MRLADNLPRGWEQSTGTDLVRPLLQSGGGKEKEGDVFQDPDSDGDDEHSQCGENDDSDLEAEEEDSDANDSDTKDPDWVFYFVLDHTKNRFKKVDVDYDLKALRKGLPKIK